MAIELDGKPLKFTAEFDSKQAEQDLDSFLKKLQNLNSSGAVGKNVSSVIGGTSSQFKTIFQDATQSYNAFNDSVSHFYSKIANGELQLQKIRNEQTILNKELKNGVITEQEYINKTAQLTQLREKLSAQIKDNKNQLAQYNKEADRKPAFTRQDTLNELTNAHGSGSSVPTLTATESFAKATQESINKLNQELTELDSKLKQGAISNQDYVKSSEKINNSLKELYLNQEHFNRNVGKGLIPSTEVKEQKSILDSVSSQYREMVEDATSAFQMISPEAKKLNNDLVALRQENKNITAAQKELSDSFERGAISEKQYIEASRDLGVQQREVKNRITETQKSITTLDNIERQSLGSIAEKTARLTKLKQTYDQLSASQRNNINVGGKIKKEYQQLSSEIDVLNNSLSGTKSAGIGSAFNSIRSIAGAMGIAFGTQQLVQFGVELFNIAKQAEGIELRFARIGDTSGLEKLRTATKNTVSDLELMKQAIKADNFRIPMDVLAKGLQFATVRANETGESVDYLVQSFTTGLGRKSKLVLDNLGISVVELNAEIEKTGDFATSVGNIIDREMAKSGQAVDTLAEKTNRLATEWSNFKKDLSKNISKIFNPGLPNASNIEKLTESYKNSFDNIKGYSASSRDEFIKDSNARLAQVNKELANYSLDSPVFKKIYDQQKGWGGKSPTQLLNDLRRPLVEQQEALQASLTYAKGITDEMATQERHSKNIFSKKEVTDKLAEANLAYDNSVGDKARAQAKKEVDKWQKLYDDMSIKSSKGISKKGESKFEKERQAVERLISLQLKVDQVNEKVKNSNLSRDEREIESIKDKYRQIRDEIAKFERDPKNKGKLVDVSGLSSSEEFEITEAKTRQSTTKLLKDLNAQREIYTQYNEYVEQNGVEAAEKMFGKQSELAKNYRATIQDEYNKIIALQKTASIASFVGVDIKLTQAQEERAKALKEILESLDKEDRARQMAKYAEALKMAETFTDKETKIRKAHNDALAQLGKDATQDQKDAIDNVLKNELQAIIEAEPKLKEAMEAISNAQAWVLPEAIDNGKQMLTNLIDGMRSKYPELSQVLDKLEKDLMAPLNRASKGAKEQKWDIIQDAVSGFEQLVNQAANFDDTLKGSLLTIADMLTTVGQLSKSLANSGSALGKALGGLGGSFPVIGAVAGIVGSVIGIFEKGAEKRRQREAEDAKYAYEYQSKQIESITKALQYQLQLVEDIYGVERVKAYGKAISDANKSANESISKVNSSQKYQLTGDRLIDEWITNRNNGKQNFFGDNILDSMISYGKIKKVELGFSKVEDITKEHLINLQKMVNDGGLDEATRTQVQNILDQYEIWKEGTNKLKEELLGISFKGVLDVTKNLFFNNGENSADAWQKGFDNVMKDYLKNLFSREFLEKELQAFYDKYYELAKSGDKLTDVEKAELESIWKNIEKNGKDRLDQLQKDLNIDLSDNASSGAIGSEGISRATEEQFSEYLGINRAIWDLNKQQLEILRSTNKSHVDYVGIANASLTRLNSIDINTANTVKELQQAVTHLKNIDTSLGRRYAG